MQIPRIKKIRYNRITCTDSQLPGQAFSYYEVGENAVEEIKENCAAGEGDKWYYDIIVNGKLKFRVFDINHVEYFD